MPNYDHTKIGDERFPEEPDALVSEAEPEEWNPIMELMKWFYVDMKLQAKILPPIITPLHKKVTDLLVRVDPKLKDLQAICIVPNKELAIENRDLLLMVGKHSSITRVLGLPPYEANDIPLAKMPPVEAQLIIGAPFTIDNWIVNDKLDTYGMRMLVIDNADRVLAEPGVKDNVMNIMMDISEKSPKCQVIMCSTISNDAVEALVSKTKQVLSEKEYISFTAITEVPSLDSVKQYKVNVPDESSKVNKLLDLITEAVQTIIFVHTIDRARMLFEKLEDNRFMFKTLDGADTQEQRDKILEEFKEKRFQVLISTKTLVQGFDLSQVGLVVFFNLSILGSSADPDLEQYSHCIGRAARFGRKGAVFNLMCGDEDKMIMEKIEMHNNVSEVLWTSDV